MLYPSIQEILKATEKDGEERLNKYSITMATAKSARVITNEYIKQREEAEKKAKDKDDKEVFAMVKKEYRDEKAVKNALREIKNGEFEIYLPGDEGYEDSTVEVINYEPGEDDGFTKDGPSSEIIVLQTSDEDEELLEDDQNELMGAVDVYEDNVGYSIVEDGEDE